VASIPAYWERDTALVSNILGTDLDSKAAGTWTITTALDNTAGLWFYADFKLILGSCNPAAATSIKIAMFTSLDGTNWPDFTDGNEREWTTRIIPAGSSVKTLNAWGWRIPPFKCRFQITHAMSVSTAASGNSLTYWLYRERSGT
jgi:hypothetical protein